MSRAFRANVQAEPGEAAESEIMGNRSRIITARATVDVTAGAPGTVALVGAARGISAVSITTPNPPNRRAVRFTFDVPMPGTDYEVVAQRHMGAGGTNIGRALNVIVRATTYFEVGLYSDSAGAWAEIDVASHRFGVFVSQ